VNWGLRKISSLSIGHRYITMIVSLKKSFEGIEVERSEAPELLCLGLAGLGKTTS
jgi:hypothetical protein